MNSAWQRYKEKLGDTRPWELLNPNAPKADDTTVSVRMSHCNSCPEYIQTTKQCKKCLCIMPLKTKLLDAKCPLGHW